LSMCNEQPSFSTSLGSNGTSTSAEAEAMSACSSGRTRRPPERALVHRIGR
jgi:hypothetical protein